MNTRTRPTYSTEFVANVASDNNPLAVPLAAVIGIPLYIRAEAVIPLSAALKGITTWGCDGTDDRQCRC